MKTSYQQSMKLLKRVRHMSDEDVSWLINMLIDHHDAHVPDGTRTGKGTVMHQPHLIKLFRACLLEWHFRMRIATFGCGERITSGGAADLRAKLHDQRRLGRKPRYADPKDTSCFSAERRIPQDRGDWEWRKSLEAWVAYHSGAAHREDAARG